MKTAILYICPTRDSRTPRRRRLRVLEYAEQHGIEIVGEEIESIGAKKLLAFERAKAQANDGGHLLLIDRLGHLVKSPAFLERLRDSEWQAIDYPDYGPERLDELIAWTSDRIQKNRVRSQEALDRMKAAGVKMGAARPGHKSRLAEFSAKGVKRASELRTERTRDYYSFVMPMIIEMREQGASYETIAEKLNEQGLRMQTGKPYHQVGVFRLKKRWEDEHKKKIAPEYDRLGTREKKELTCTRGLSLGELV